MEDLLEGGGGGGNVGEHYTHWESLVWQKLCGHNLHS